MPAKIWQRERMEIFYGKLITIFRMESCGNISNNLGIEIGVLSTIFFSLLGPFRLSAADSFSRWTNILFARRS